MSVYIEADAKGRMSIQYDDGSGGGHGYRLCGPSYIGDSAPVIARRVLDARDVAELRSYLALAAPVVGEREEKP